jgi:hypothetical protein
VRFFWTSSMRKHRISRHQVRHVVEHAGLIFLQPPPRNAALQDPRLIYLGDDETGAPIEIMAVKAQMGGEDGLLVIHAMELREKYRAHYEEAKRWRR